MMNRCIFIAVLTILIVACTRATTATASTGVIFMYHHVDSNTPPATSVTPTQFREQIELLEADGYSVIPLLEMLEAVKSGTTLPEKSVALTFDDAYESVLHEAMPLLVDRNWPFTVFVSTESIDQGFRGYLNWDQLRELGRNGATIGNHSVSHTHLVRQLDGESNGDWLQRVTGEIDTAQSRLEEEVGDWLVPVIAYPYGEYTREIKEIVADRGMYGLGQQSGALGQVADLQAVPRYPVAASLSLDDFSLRARSLPLPARVTGEDAPIVQGDDVRPVLEITIEPDDDIRIDDLACYASNQGRMEIEWIDRDDRQLRARPANPLGPGRNKYNCTAPSRASSGTYYWFSYLWMNRLPDGSWYQE